MRLEELKKILDRMLETAKWGQEDREWYKPLIELGVIDSEGILWDNFLDANAVLFARKLLDLIDE